MNRHQHERRALACALSLFGLVAGCATAPKVIEREPVCQMWLTDPVQIQGTFRSEHWMELLVKPYAGQAGYMAERDCRGAPIVSTRSDKQCLVQAAYLGDLQLAALTEASVVQRKLADGRLVVWVVTHRYPNADGFGPVAIVRHEGARLLVDALGLLRMRTTRVELDIWSIGGHSVLVAQGETCRDSKVPDSCKRAANLLVVQGEQLLDVPITYRDGKCIDEPWLEFHMESDQDLDTGWNRNIEINTTFTHDDRYLVITEQIEIRDSDPEQPELPPRTVRKVNTERFIHVEGGKLTTKQNPLWPKVLPAKGKVKLTRELD